MAADLPAVGPRRATPREPGLSRREANKADVRLRLLRAARELFARHGVAGTTIEDIARSAAVSRATVFNYFPTKGHIVGELVAAFERGLRHAVDRQLTRPVSTAERLRGVFLETAQEGLRAPALSRLLIGELESGFGSSKVSGRRMARMYTAFSDLLGAGRERGDVRADVSIDTLAEIVGGTYMAIFHGWRLSQRYPLLRRFEEAARVLGQIMAPQAAGRASRNRG